MIRRGAGLLVLWTLLPVTSLAQGGPPLRTDDPATPGAGIFELNVATAFEKDGSETAYEAPLLDLNYGLGETMQLKVELLYLWLHERGDGTRGALGAGGLGWKWRFVDPKRGAPLHASIYPQVSFNLSPRSVDLGLNERSVEVLFPVQAERKFGPISLNAELGYALRTRAPDEWVYGLAAGHEIWQGAEILAEIHGVSEADLEETLVVWGTGFRLDLLPSMTLLGAGGTGLISSKRQPDAYGYLGFQFLF